MNKYEKIIKQDPMTLGIIVLAICNNHNIDDKKAIHFFDQLPEDVRNDIVDAVYYTRLQMKNMIEEWKEEAERDLKGMSDNMAKRMVCEAICRCDMAKDALDDARQVYNDIKEKHPQLLNIMLQTAKETFKEIALDKHILEDKTSEIKIEVSDNSGDKAAELKQVDKGETVKERVENVAIMELAKNCIMEEMKCDYDKAEELLKANPMWARVIINIVRTGKSIFPLKL